MRNSIAVNIFFLFISFAVSCGGQRAEPKVISAKAKIDITADGLGVRTMMLKPQEGTLAEHFELFGEHIEDASLESQLLRSGIHVRRIHTEEIQVITELVGTTLEEKFVWHGQVPKWRDIIQRLIPAGGMYLDIEGDSHFVNTGYLSLLIRTWLVEQEKGIYVYLQVLPTWHVPSKYTSVAGKVRKTSRSNVFFNLQLDILLKDEEALLLGVELPATIPSEVSPTFLLGEALLGEALLGAPVDEDKVMLLILQANLQSEN